MTANWTLERDADDIAEEEAILDMYKAALGM